MSIQDIIGLSIVASVIIWILSRGEVAVVASAQAMARITVVAGVVAGAWWLRVVAGVWLRWWRLAPLSF